MLCNAPGQAAALETSLRRAPGTNIGLKWNFGRYAGVFSASSGYLLGMMKAGFPTAVVLFALFLAPEVHAQEPVNRWGPDYNRATRVPRAGEAPVIRRIPPRVYPKLKIPEPYLKTAPPRYGTPKRPIERIPET